MRTGILYCKGRLGNCVHCKRIEGVVCMSNKRHFWCIAFCLPSLLKFWRDIYCLATNPCVIDSTVVGVKWLYLLMIFRYLSQSHALPRQQTSIVYYLVVSVTWGRRRWGQLNNSSRRRPSPYDLAKLLWLLSLWCAILMQTAINSVKKKLDNVVSLMLCGMLLIYDN